MWRATTAKSLPKGRYQNVGVRDLTQRPACPAFTLLTRPPFAGITESEILGLPGENVDLESGECGRSCGR